MNECENMQAGNITFVVATLLVLLLFMGCNRYISLSCLCLFTTYVFDPNYFHTYVWLVTISLVIFAPSMDDVKWLKIIHFNIRSLVRKIDLLRAWVVLHKPNIIALSESWLNSNISDNDINLPNMFYMDLIGAPDVGVWRYTFSLISYLN